ncbi:MULTISPECIES: DUF3088 family protein [Caulobacter]|jgi:hypothetical protein|uniref:DUF3088 domain-containing protein n=1 Tax=Caulobacter vibrioides OR37 TaxID=1292034 RepID=R0E944_CAUVI|nr:MULTISPECIES: DUF3088 family protein [Caulobacter]ENZ82003.1 hypothetical protein OR37_02047 [Caulobacter vibrioides OR37]MBQ1560983.1 DUF3088 domain-containing protein [Caulobacter sp.]
MAKDTLYLLQPHFEKDGAERFCPDCAMMEGYLATYPALREAVDIVYVDYGRPRAALVARLGEDHQNAPTLILAAAGPDAGPHGEIQSANGLSFLTDARPITRWLAARHGLAAPL